MYPLFLLAPCCPATATTPQASLFGQADGLANISVMVLAQQPDGHIWIGTQHGLFLYDGATIREFGETEGLPEAWISELFIEHRGRVVVADLLDPFWFDGLRFHELRYQGQSLQFISHSMLTETRTGDLIVGTPKGFLSPLRDQHTQDWTTLAPREDSYGLNKMHLTGGVFTDHSGKLWFDCNRSICSEDGPRGQDVMEGTPPDDYITFFQQRNGQLWAGGSDHFVTWNRGDSKVRDLTATFLSGQIHYPFRQIAEDVQGDNGDSERHLSEAASRRIYDARNRRRSCAWSDVRSRRMAIHSHTSLVAHPGILCVLRRCLSGAVGGTVAPEQSRASGSTKKSATSRAGKDAGA